MAVCGVEAPAADGAALGDDRPVQRSTGYDDPGFHLDPSPTRHPSRGRRPPAPTTRRPAGSHDRHRGGRPGGSAHAEYQRHRAREHASWAHTRPWWVTASLGAGLVTLVAATLLNLPLPAWAALSPAALAAAWWRLRFRPSPETRAWARLHPAA